MQPHAFVYGVRDLKINELAKRTLRSVPQGTRYLEVYDVPCKSESLRIETKSKRRIAPSSAPRAIFFLPAALALVKDTERHSRGGNGTTTSVSLRTRDAVSVPDLLVAFAEGTTIQSRVYATQHARRAFVEGCFRIGPGCTRENHKFHCTLPGIIIDHHAGADWRRQDPT